jgi:hypothetical protein
MVVDHSRGLRRTGADALLWSEGFIGWSWLRRRLAARNGNFKSITLRQRFM